MATSGISSNVEEECIGGGCGQVLSVADHNTEQTESNFQSCENTKENALSMVLKELQKMKAEMSEMKAEMRKEMEDNKKEFDKQILELKSEFKKESEIKDVALSNLFRKVKNLEEKAKGTTSANTILIDKLDRSKREVLWEQTQTIKTKLEELKIEMETFLEQLKPNNKDLRAIKGLLEDEKTKNESTKMTFHVEPSPFQQLTIPMNEFNLVMHNKLFQPSFRWPISGIEAIVAQKTFEMSSQMFRWNGYPVRARAKLELKENDCFYMSLSLEEQLKNDSTLKGFKPIPRLFYLLKDKFYRQTRHRCRSVAYLSDCDFRNSLKFGLCIAHKSWFDLSSCNANNSVEIDIYVEPFAMTQHVHSYDGMLEWNIENYSRRLPFEKHKLVYYQESPYFYTGPSGYRVQVGMYLNGSGAKGPTAYIMFLSGKFDADLPKSFPHCTTVTLVNRKDPERSVVKTIIKDIENKKEYKFEICEVDEAEDLIENDTLFCKVVIKAQ